jgi:pimeloyl-ACP methyl ester carboxylesterase
MRWGVMVDNVDNPADFVTEARPIILIRGFGGLGTVDERRVAYQGFNDGTVYPGKRGENYIYEGLVLRLLKSDWEYRDATNVVGYYPQDQPPHEELPPELKGLQKFFEGQVAADPAMALSIASSTKSVMNTVWVFRYYDFENRTFESYGTGLVRLVDFIRALAKSFGQNSPPKVNIIAHSMGGLIVRHAVQVDYPRIKKSARAAEDYIHKIVTLGTPHRGISFQVLDRLAGFGAAEELNAFDPEGPAADSDESDNWSFKRFGDHFNPRRLLTVVGTNFKAYGSGAAVLLNRIASVPGEFGPAYNRSDGLVKQAFAQVPGAPRTFVHKCHGGSDSLVTSREAFEIATRYFYGNVYARLRLVEAKITRGMDLFGRSEFFLGVSIKPRGVDFDLFHQSAEAQNCYGPFHSDDLSDDLSDDGGFDWADHNERLIWEGWLDTRVGHRNANRPSPDLVIRLDIYVGERDRWGIGFSDNRVYQKQYYLQAMLSEPKLFLHTGEKFLGPSRENDSETLLQEIESVARNKDDRTVDACKFVNGEWQFEVKGTGFRATFAVRLAGVEGAPAVLGGGNDRGNDSAAEAHAR